MIKHFTDTLLERLNTVRDMGRKRRRRKKGQEEEKEREGERGSGGVFSR